MKPILITLLLLARALGYELLNGIPITFSLAGNVSYTPSSGGVNIPGYRLRVGFSRYQWLGIKFMSITSESTYDVLVVSRATDPVGGYYEAQVSDYFVSSGRQSKLLADSVNNMDKEVTTYSNNDYFYVEVFRTKGDTQGEDWEGGEFVEICFLTNGQAFDQTVWTGLSSSCYGYDVSSDYESTFEGKSLGKMSVDRVESLAYGGIEGPYLKMQLYWLVSKPLLSSSDVYIRIGDKFTEEELGYDYFKCGEGDYLGPSVNSLTPDTLWSGYNDGSCEITNSLTSTKISYSRNVFTGDGFDSLIFGDTKICVIVGEISSCKQLTLPTLYPVMSVDSAFQVFEDRLQWAFTALLVLLVCLFM